MGLPNPTLFSVLRACALLLVLSWLGTLLLDCCGDRRIYFDRAEGLQAGDGVYAARQRVGSVSKIQPHGRRLAIDLRLRCHVAATLNPHTTFFLDRDPENPERLCLRALSHGTPNLKDQAKSR